MAGIAAVAQFFSTHASKYHSLGFSAARASGFLFDVRNGPDEADAVVTVNYQGNMALDGTLDVAGVSTLTGRVETGAVLVGINESANANMTVGITINQGANDNHILDLKSSDVAHGFTSRAEADTFCKMQKGSGTAGGLRLEGYRDASSGGNALDLYGLVDGNITTKATTSAAKIMMVAGVLSGTNGDANGADANLVAIADWTSTRFIFDAEGSAHADVEWTTFDRHDDLAVIEDMETLLAPGQVQRQFGQVVTHDRGFFEREGLLHDLREVAPGRMRGMINTTRMMMLHTGAIRQVGGRTQALEATLRHLLDNPNDRAGALALLGAA